MKTLILILLLAALPARADVNADFAAANRLYQQGNFAAAAAGYEQLVQSGVVSPALQFNLGNARLKAGSEGRALAAFRQAQLLAPRATDLRANLQFARARVTDAASLRPTTLQRAFARLTLNEWLTLAGLAVAVWFTLLAGRAWRPELRAKLGGATQLAALASGGLLLGALAAWTLNYSEPAAVVIANEAAVRSGPLDDATTVFSLKDGVELAVTAEREDWLQIRDAQNRSGWLKRTDAQVVP
ncbi:MAG: BatE protein [Verrucomicrobiota bacterium]|jgi:tetratricopeptide (TPR) repeat protein